MRDIADLLPYTDDYTAHLLDEATATLAWLRGLDRDRDPAVRLHLLASIHAQVKADLLLAVLAAHDHGHAPDELAALLDQLT